MSEETIEFNLDGHTNLFSEAIENERSSRLGVSIIPYGISFLDDAFGGISKTDLIVFGARTGTGKTQLALQIATSAAKNGKRVLFFALESTKYEIAQRYKFSKLYQHLKVKYGFPPRYGDWVLGKIIEDESVKISVDEWMKNIRTIHRVESFTPSDIRKNILAFKEECDLVIIDHLHYIDMESENENTELKQAVKDIRTLSLDIGIPFILISHIRKPDRFDKVPWPSIHDFHGSSDISKIATQCFSTERIEALIKKKVGNKSQAIYDYSPVQGTLFTVLKNRNDGDCLHSKAMLTYSHGDRAFLNPYFMVSWDAEKKWLKQSDDIPSWAKSAMECV